MNIHCIKYVNQQTLMHFYSDEEDEEFYLDAEGSVARISHSNDPISDDKTLQGIQGISAKIIGNRTKLQPK
jgi:hypothetical protein